MTWIQIGEESIEPPNIDSFLRLKILIRKPAILVQFLQTILCSTNEGFQHIFQTIHKGVKLLFTVWLEFKME